MRVAVALLTMALLAVGATACSEDVDPDQALKEGLAQQQAGDLEAAAEQYQMVLDVRPDDQYANYNMGVIEQSDGRTALAEGYYRAALDTAPDFVPALFNLAILRTKAGATQEAIDLYERVIVIQPEYAAAHLNLGLLYRDAERAEARPAAPQHGDRARSEPRRPDHARREPDPGATGLLEPEAQRVGVPVVPAILPGPQTAGALRIIPSGYLPRLRNEDASRSMGRVSAVCGDALFHVRRRDAHHRTEYPEGRTGR